MSQLIWLKATDIGIIDLIDLEYAVNLESLDLVDNQIGDISPLTGLTQLTWLSLWHNQVQDITPLTNLTKLKTWDLSYNYIICLTSTAQSISRAKVLPMSTTMALSTFWIWSLSPSSSASKYHPALSSSHYQNRFATVSMKQFFSSSTWNLI